MNRHLGKGEKIDWIKQFIGIKLSYMPNIMNFPQTYVTLQHRVIILKI